MSAAIHTFTIVYEFCEIVTFAHTDKAELTVRVNEYLDSDVRFGQFLHALNRVKDLDDEQQSLVGAAIAAGVRLSFEEIVALKDVDQDDIAFRIGRIDGWQYTVCQSSETQAIAA